VKDVFSLEKRKKSQGANIEEYGGCLRTVTSFFSEKNNNSRIYYCIIKVGVEMK
jgi:hypothetical protein